MSKDGRGVAKTTMGSSGPNGGLRGMGNRWGRNPEIDSDMQTGMTRKFETSSKEWGELAGRLLDDDECVERDCDCEDHQ